VLKNQKFFWRYSLILLIFCGHLSSNTLNSQTLALDSINQIVKSSLPDTTIIDAINDYSYRHSANYPHYTIPLSNIAVEKSKALDDSFRISRSLNRKAIAYYFMGDYNNALDHYFQSLQINEKLNDSVYIATDFNNIGLVLIEVQLFDEALSYFNKSKNLLDTIRQKDKYARVLDNIGIAYYSMQKHDSALVWFQKSLKINREVNQRQTIASNIKNVGNVLRAKNRYPQALTHYKLALEIYEELDAKLEIQNLLNQSAAINLKIGNYSEAKDYINRAKKYLPEINSLNLELDLMKIEAEFFNLTGDYNKSINLLNKYAELKDSTHFSEKHKNYEQLKTLAEANEKVKDIELLRLVNNIQKEQIRSQRIIQIAIIISLLFSIIIIFLVINALKSKNQLNKKLETLVDDRTKELLLAKEQAEISDKLKTAFLQNISHEVRTPMNAIIGFSDLLVQRQYNDSDRNDILRNISRGTIRLLQLFEKISYLAQLENNDITAKKIDCNLEELFNRLFVTYSEQIESCNLSLTLSYKIDDDIKGINLFLPLRIIESTLNELIENSIKFSKKGEVAFGVEKLSEKINFYIKDSGEGIASENIDKIFDKFIKFNPTNCEHNDGAGIGLTIVKKNLELINCEIHVESIQGKGSIFKFSIPIEHIQS
jgi:signal transduction histidine kinase/Tfp pilus assembly protein PilF